MAYNGPQTPRKKTALSEWKLRLTAPPEQGAKKNPTFAVDLNKNNPRFVVYTNVPDDKDNGRIMAPMDSLTFYAALEAVRQIADGKSDDKITIDNKNFTFYQQKRSPEPVVISKTVIGKDKEGKVFIAITAKDRPLVKFVFLPSSYHTMTHSDGTAFSPGELSVIYAKGWVDCVGEIMGNLLVTEYEEPPPREDGNGGGGNKGGYGGGGGNRGGGGGNSYGGGGNKSSGDNWDTGSSGGGDDFPM